MGLTLNRSVTVTASAAGTASASLGPSSGKGPARWNVMRIAVRNEAVARRGQPPIPAGDLYTDSEAPDNWIDGTYDGSFDGTDCDISLTRGQVVLFVWAGAQAGDRLTLSVYGTMED